MVCSLQSTLLAQYRFDHWTADNGLPQNSVRDIVQTRDGYVWLTTFDGLARFDGVRFTVFNKSNSPGIVTNRFVMLYEDGQGDLWATTENSGLTRLHAGRFTTWTTEYGLPTNYVTSIGGDGYGGVLLFFGRSLFRWANGKFLPADDLRIADKMDLLDHYQHAVCGGDVSEIRCFVNGQVRSWNTVELPPSLALITPVQDEQGNLWFGSPEGLVKVREGHEIRRFTARDGLPGNRTQIIYGSQPLQALVKSADGSLWLTEVESLKSRRILPQVPAGMEVAYAVYGDREGNLWIATYRNGLYRLRPQAVTAYAKAQGLKADEIYPITEDQAGAIWIGSAGDGLFRFQDGVFTPYNRVPVPHWNSINSLFKDRAGHLWANGRLRFEHGRLVRRVSEAVLPDYALDACWTMYEDQDGALWFGTVHGVVRDKNGVSAYFTTKDGLAGDDTKVIIGDGKGGLWLGSTGGLTHYQGGQFKAWAERDGLPGNTVRALKQDNDGTLWIGTYDSGLGRFKDGKFTRFTTKEGLFDNGVFQILEDDFGWCWMSCNRGIYRVRKQELNDFADGKIKAVNSIRCSGKV